MIISLLVTENCVAYSSSLTPGHSDGGGFSKYSTLSRMFYLQDILTEVDSLLYVVTDVLFTGYSDGGEFSTLRCDVTDVFFTGHSDGGGFSTLRCHGRFLYRTF